MLTIGDALHSTNDENAIGEYSMRLLDIIDRVLSPQRIFFECDRISKDKAIELSQRTVKLVPSNTRKMIFSGLMELTAEQILNEI